MVREAWVVWTVRLAVGLCKGCVCVRRWIGVVAGVRVRREVRRKVEEAERTEVMRVSWEGVVREVWRRGRRDMVVRARGGGGVRMGRRDDNKRVVG